jgi:signal transduction histidine kinase
MEIVKAHDGKICAQANLEGGSDFVFTLKK